MPGSTEGKGPAGAKVDQRQDETDPVAPVSYINGPCQLDSSRAVNCLTSPMRISSAESEEGARHGNGVDDECRKEDCNQVRMSTEVSRSRSIEKEKARFCACVPYHR